MAGCAGAGVVTAVGSSVTGFAVNDSVLIIDSGLWTEETVVSQNSAAKVAGMSAAEIATLPAYLSAWAILNNFNTSLKAGDIVVQTNGTGAVGSAVAQIGKAMGLNVVSLSSDELKDAKLADNLKKKGDVKLAVAGQSGTHVVNMVRALSPSGCLVAYNGIAQPVSQAVPISLPISGMIFSDTSVHGFDLTSWVRANPLAYHSAVTSLCKMVGDNKLSVKAGKTFKQAEYVKAIEEVRSSGTAAVLQ